MAQRAWDPDRWSFSAEEVSPGVWEALADDGQGERLRRVRYDSDEALALVKSDVAEITRRRREASRGDALDKSTDAAEEQL